MIVIYCKLLITLAEGEHFDKRQKAKDQRANLLGPSRQNHIAGGARDPGAIPPERISGAWKILEMRRCRSSELNPFGALGKNPQNVEDQVAFVAASRPRAGRIRLSWPVYSDRAMAAGQVDFEVDAGCDQGGHA